MKEAKKSKQEMRAREAKRAFDGPASLALQCTLNQ